MKNVSLLALVVLINLSTQLFGQNIIIDTLSDNIDRRTPKSYNLKLCDTFVLINKTKSDAVINLTINDSRSIISVLAEDKKIKKDSSFICIVNKDSLIQDTVLYLRLVNYKGQNIDLSEMHYISYVPNDSIKKRFVFYEALELAKLLKKSEANESKIINLLCKTSFLQLHNCSKRDSIAFLKAYFNKNKFIEENILNKLKLDKTKKNDTIYEKFSEDVKEFTAQATSSVANYKEKSIFSTIGNLNATIYADAFAKIIVKRFKQDMNEIFFENMKKELEKYIELRTLLPCTYQTLRTIDKDIYAYETYIEGLRQCMEEDLANIFSNTNKLLETDAYINKFATNPTLRGFLTTVSQFSDGLIRKHHPGTIIENIYFSAAYDENTEGVKIKGGMQTIQLFSKGLQTNDKTTQTIQLFSKGLQTNDKTTQSFYWVRGLDSLNLLFKDNAIGAQIWLGLLYELAIDEQGKPIQFGQDTTLQMAINSLYDEKDKFFKMEKYVKGLMRRTNDIGESWRAMESATDNKTTWHNMVSLYSNTIDLVKFVPSIEEIFDSNFVMPRNWYEGLYMAETLARIYAEMKGREYHAAIQHVGGLLKVIEPKEMYVLDKTYKTKKIIPIRVDTLQYLYEDSALRKPVKEYSNLEGKYFKYQNKPVLITDIKIKKDSSYKTLDYPALEKFINYANFAASLALAKTSDEVAEVLESKMTPSGRTRDKENGFIWGINSYLAGQYIFKNKKDGLSSRPVWAISAPIGLNFSFGINKNGPKWLPHNVQILGSIVDIGAFVGLRLSNNTDSIPKVQLHNIFSPGVFLNLGRWQHIPLNIGFGIQAQPRLYKIKDAALFFEEPKYRASLNISWDIPLWNIRYKKYD